MTLKCYRCGADLDRLTLPLARLDVCPACGVELHVCMMCSHYAPTIATACDEDDAEEVSEKARANFCEYFLPSPDVFDGSLAKADRRARGQLDSLFGAESDSATGVDSDDATNDALEQANALFKD